MPHACTLSALLEAVARIRQRTGGFADSGQSIPLDDRVNKMADMRRAGRSLSEIGAAFGVSRERIRQLLCPLHIEVDARRVPESVAAERLALKRRHKFARIMRAHLRSIGVARCGSCGVWQEMVVANRRCPDCNRRNAYIQYHEHDGAARQKRWQQANKDKLRIYQQRYYAKHKTKVQQEKT